jgi:hypothetical protein
VPEGSGPFAGILYLHPGEGDRATFLSEAITFFSSFCAIVQMVPWVYNDLVVSPRNPRERLVIIPIWAAKATF